MGQRGAKAAFMPDKFVFPGGAVDRADYGVSPVEPLAETCQRRLAVDTPDELPAALAAAAVRELWEETGLAIGAPNGSEAGPQAEEWRSFYATGLLPRISALTFFFRAITPKGRPRRFDARFFLADAAALAGDIDDFSQASDELRHLQWVPMDEARALPLPFVTEVVLAEVEKLLARGGAPEQVPYFRHGVSGSGFHMIP